MPGKPHTEEHKKKYEQVNSKDLLSWDHHIATA
jgi:hypothetical protein